MFVFTTTGDVSVPPAWRVHGEVSSDFSVLHVFGEVGLRDSNDVLTVWFNDVVCYCLAFVAVVGDDSLCVQKREFDSCGL